MSDAPQSDGEAASPIVRTESLGGSELSRAARAGALPQWYRPVPGGAADWKGYARDVGHSAPAGWFSDVEDAIAPEGRAALRIRASARGQGFVVTTGQQPGLFGGPLMTLVKAISARALADVLQETIGQPVAPLFWAATDDADFDEAAVVGVALDGGARELRLSQRPLAGTPVARAPIGPEVDQLAPMLREACGSAPHAAWLDRALDAFQAGNGIGDAYVAVLRAVLEPLEMAVLDVSHPCVSRAAVPFMARAAARAEPLARSLERRAHEIAEAGFSPQVEDVQGLSLVFINENGTKRRLPVQEALALPGVLVPRADDDRFLSGTALLRPVLERALLPTLAYVGGPGEVAYFAQVSAVADTLDVPTPLVVPRWSATILEPRVRRALDALGIGPDELADPHAVEGRLARERLGPDTDHALRSLRLDLASDVDRLAGANAVNHHLVPPAVIDGLRRTLEHRLMRLERRILAAVKRRETDVMRQVATVRGSLYPDGVRQERKLAFIPFLARYGPALIDEMLGAAHAHARSLVAGTPISSATSSPAPARV